MGNIATYAAHALLDLSLGAVAFTRPANVFASLHTAPLTVTGSGAEVSGSAYARKSIANNATNFPAAAALAKALAVRQTFSAASGGSWGTVTDCGLWDAVSAGNLLVCDAIAANQTVANLDAPYIEAATGLVITFSGDISTYLGQKLLDHMLGGGDYSPPANVFLGLFVSGVEVSGNGYARKSVANNATNFPAASARAKALGTEQQFVEPTASWGTVDEVRLFDASTAGNTLASKALTTPRALAPSNPGVFQAGSLTFTWT